MYHSYTWVNRGKVSGDRGIPNCGPVSLVVSAEWFCSKFEPGVGDTGVVLPNVLVGSCRSTRFGVDPSSKSVGDGGQPDVSSEDDQKLPVNVVSGLSSFQLSSDVRASIWKIREESMLWNSKKPVSCALHIMGSGFR